MALPSPVFPTTKTIRILPFYSTVSTIDRYRALKRRKYVLYDVKADGHCGIYAIIIGHIMYHSTDADILRVDLPKLFLETRQALHSTMSQYGKAIVAANKANMTFQLLFDLQSAKDWNEVLTGFYDASLSEEAYQNVGAQPLYHVSKSWIALIAAITYNMPVIQHTHYTSDRETSFATEFYDGTTYDSTTHKLEVSIFPKFTVLDSSPDKPPLELLFQASAQPTRQNAPPIDQHIMVLHRPPPPPVFPSAKIIKTLPFYANEGTIDAYPKLKLRKYELIDVAGDGHCGIYSIIIGRIMYHSTSPKIPPHGLQPLVLETR